MSRCGVDFLVQGKDHWWDCVNTVMNIWVPLNPGNFLSSSATVSFPRTMLYGIRELTRDKRKSPTSLQFYSSCLILPGCHQPEYLVAFLHPDLYFVMLWHDKLYLE